MELSDGTVVAERRVRAGEVTLNLVEAGPPDGPPVLLLHGFPEFWRSWRKQIGPLAAAGFRVVAPDGRGYNRSDKPSGISAYRLERLEADVVALADALGFARFRLVGHDWGGIVAWRVAARHPDRVERLAILNAPHPDTWLRRALTDRRQAGRSWYVAFFQLPFAPERLLAADDYAFLRKALVGSGRRKTFSEEDLARYREAWSRPGALAAMLNYYRALLRRPAGRSGRIRPPTLILWGRRDSALVPEQATDAVAMCDDGRVLWLDRATHWVQHEEPEAVNAALIEHLRG